MNDFGSLHYNSIAPRLREQFGSRVVKLSLDGGFTCPNRDGSCGYGGCSFCSSDGSGSFAGTVQGQIALLSRKWPNALYLAYFQNHTNTYAPADKLRRLWDEALSNPGMVGLAVATRPDCLPDAVLGLLEEYNKKTFLWVELGLQTSNQRTADAFGRGYKNDVYEKACRDLSAIGVRTVSHMIVGLPGEHKADALATADYINSFSPYGIKIHMLHLMKDTRMGEEYLQSCRARGLTQSDEGLGKSGSFDLPGMEEYIGTVADILERTPKSVTVHRLTGDAPRQSLIAPLWTADKHAVLNGIQQEFKRRGSWQGKSLE